MDTVMVTTPQPHELPELVWEESRLLWTAWQDARGQHDRTIQLCQKLAQLMMLFKKRTGLHPASLHADQIPEELSE